MPSGGVHSISGPEAAATLWSEGLFRTFNNRKRVAAYAGLAPTPWQSGAVHRDQGVSKAGNPRLRTIMIQIAWLWLRHQPQSALAVWYRERIKRTGGSGALRFARCLVERPPVELLVLVAIDPSGEEASRRHLLVVPGDDDAA